MHVFSGTQTCQRVTSGCIMKVFVLLGTLNGGRTTEVTMYGETARPSKHGHFSLVVTLTGFTVVRLCCWVVHFRPAHNSQRKCYDNKTLPNNSICDAGDFCTRQNTTKCNKSRYTYMNVRVYEATILNEGLGYKGITNIWPCSCTRTHSWQLSCTTLSHVSLQPSRE